MLHLRLLTFWQLGRSLWRGWLRPRDERPLSRSDAPADPFGVTFRRAFRRRVNARRGVREAAAQEICVRPRVARRGERRKWLLRASPPHGQLHVCSYGSCGVEFAIQCSWLRSWLRSSE